MNTRNLDEMQKLYNCFSHVDKLRIWNLFLIPTAVMIPSDVQKVLGLSSGVFNYFREFLESGLIFVDNWSRRKVYFFKDKESEKFVASIINQINDRQLEIDKNRFLYDKRAGFLQISGQHWSINNGRIAFNKAIKPNQVDGFQYAYVVDLVKRLNRSIKHNRIDEIERIKKESKTITWEKYPLEQERFKGLIEKLK